MKNLKRLFVKFTVIFSSRQRQVQLPAMKQNSCAVVGEVTKPTGVGLDELDGAIETFSTGVADFVLTEVEQTRLMPPEHLDHLFDWLQATAHGVGGPRIKETLGSTFVAVAPELGEVLLDAPGPTGFEVELVQDRKSVV